MTEIYIIKQIDNSRLTKVLDLDRTKECVYLILFGTFCLLIFLYLAVQHHRVLQLGYEIEVQKKELTQMENTFQQLTVETAHLKDPNRIIPLAKQLGLQEVSFDQVMVWPGALPAEPSTTMVAQTEKLPVGPDTGRGQRSQ
jgi:cell division protein FtsL